jgi:hypothetical protein
VLRSSGANVEKDGRVRSFHIRPEELILIRAPFRNLRGNVDSVFVLTIFMFIYTLENQAINIVIDVDDFGMRHGSDMSEVGIVL